MNNIAKFIAGLFAERPVAPAPASKPEPEVIEAPGGSALASGAPEVSALGRKKGFTLEGGIRWHRL